MSARTAYRPRVRRAPAVPGDAPDLPGGYEGLDVGSRAMRGRGLIGGVGLPELQTVATPTIDARATGAVGSPTYDLPKIASTAAYANSQAAAVQRKADYDAGQSADKNIDQNAETAAAGGPAVANEQADQYERAGRPALAASLRKLGGGPDLPGGSSLPPAPQLPDPREALAHVFGMTGAALIRGGHTGSMEEVGHHALTAISAHPDGQMLLAAADNATQADQMSISSQVDAQVAAEIKRQPYGQDIPKLREQFTKMLLEDPARKASNAEQEAYQRQMGTQRGLVDPDTGVVARSRGVARAQGEEHNATFRAGIDDHVAQAEGEAGVRQDAETEGANARRLFSRQQKGIEGATESDQKYKLHGDIKALDVAGAESMNDMRQGAETKGYRDRKQIDLDTGEARNKANQQGKELAKTAGAQARSLIVPKATADKQAASSYESDRAAAMKEAAAWTQKGAPGYGATDDEKIHYELQTFRRLRNQRGQETGPPPQMSKAMMIQKLNDMEKRRGAAGAR